MNYVNHVKKLLLGMALILSVGLTKTSAQAQAGTFTLTILHTNDVHGNHLPGDDGEGGLVRQAAIVKQIREEIPNTLLLDAGGRFTGTLYHKVHQGQDSVRAMNLLKYDAMTLMNTEFDGGPETLAKFIDAAKFPVVSSNVEITNRTSVLAGKIKTSVVLTVGGQKIGVIGLTPRDTRQLSSPGPDVSFNRNYSDAVNRATALLKRDGINKIILLSALGFDEDKKLAESVSDIDVIVGGNVRNIPMSNLFKGATSNYPIVTKSKTNEPVVLVQSANSSDTNGLKFMGRLDLEFDDKGVITNKHTGDLILLARYAPADAEAKALVDELTAEVTAYEQKPVVALDGKNATAADDFIYNRDDCRSKECPVGDLIADSMRYRANSQIAMVNGGGFRDSLKAGEITQGAIWRVLPFSNRLSIVKISGADLLVALENGVSRVGSTQGGTGRFPQVSGMRYSYDPKAPENKRILQVEILNEDSGKFAPLDPQATYTLATVDFMRQGGDGYSVLKEKATAIDDIGPLLEDVVRGYIEARSPLLVPKGEDRIVVKSGSATAPATKVAIAASPTVVATKITSTATQPPVTKTTSNGGSGNNNPSGMCANISDQIKVTLQIDLLLVVDPEEADTTSIVGGDEAEMIYAIFGKGLDGQPESTPRFAQKWTGDLVKGSQISKSAFPALSRSFQCGLAASVGFTVSESDAPFGGDDTLGTELIAISLTPTGIASVVSPKTVTFTGRTGDGTYDYRVTYSVAFEMI